MSLPFHSPFTPKRLAYPRQDGQASPAPAEGLVGSRPENSEVGDLTPAEQKKQRSREQSRKSSARHRLKKKVLALQQEIEELQIQRERAAFEEMQERRREQSRKSSARHREKKKEQEILREKTEELQIRREQAAEVGFLTPAEKKNERRREQWRKSAARHREKQRDLEANLEANLEAKKDLERALLMQIDNVDDGVQKQREVYGTERKVCEKEGGVIASATKEKSNLLKEYKNDALKLATPARPYSQKRKASEMLSSGKVPPSSSCSGNDERSSKKMKTPSKALFSPKPTVLNPLKFTGKSLTKFHKFLETIPDIIDGKEISLKKANGDFPKALVDTVESFLENKLTTENETFLKLLVDRGNNGIGELHQQVEGKVPSEVYSLVDCLVSSLDPNGIEVECREFLHHLVVLFLQGSNDEEPFAPDIQAPKELIERIETLTDEVENYKDEVENYKAQIRIQADRIEVLENKLTEDDRLKDQQLRRKDVQINAQTDHLDRLLREIEELRRGQR